MVLLKTVTGKLQIAIQRRKQISRADQSHRRRKNPLAAVFRAVGIILLIAIIAICVPLIVPKTMGYQLYTVVSGSMEPAVTTGSLVYIKYVEPGDIETGDIIAFYGSDAQGSIITHRVVSNSNAMGEFITKGDANAENDMNPVTYEQYVGKMVRSIPKVGGIVQTITVGSGKTVLKCVIGLAIVLQVLAAVLNRKYEDGEAEDTD